MLNKKSLKFALLIPAFAGLIFMASTPDFSDNSKKKEIKEAPAGVVSTDKIAHDFGTISEDGGKVDAVFTVINKTDKPILLTKVKASCGCTAPSWTKEPIEPGKTGEVTATFNPKGRRGPIDKSVTIMTSGSPERIVVRLKGLVE